MPVAQKRVKKVVRVVRGKPTSAVNVLLLIAGRSTRFWPLTEKTLWPFLGTPLLEHQLQCLRTGFGEQVSITFVGGAHNLSDVKKRFPAIPSIEQEDLALGMRGALLCAMPKVGKGPVCIVSSNDLIEAQGYRTLREAAEKPGVDGAMLAQRVKAYFPGGYLTVKRGQITGIVEKPGAGNEPSDLVNIVAHIHNCPDVLLQRLQETASKRDDAYEVALDSLFSSLQYQAVPYEKPWNALKYPWHILPIAQRFLSSVEGQSIHRSVEVDATACVRGPVVIEEGVKILAHATVQGPCYVSRGSTIGCNTLVRGSMIGPECVIGFGSEIARSCLHAKVWTHSTYLGDCVVGSDVNFGAGTVCANYRLDEGMIRSTVKGEEVDTGMTKLGAIVGSGCRIGVHCTLAPGVKIGEGTFVNSACYIDRDIPDGSFVKMGVTGLDVRENKVKHAYS